MDDPERRNIEIDQTLRDSPFGLGDSGASHSDALRRSSLDDPSSRPVGEDVYRTNENGPPFHFPDSTTDTNEWPGN